MRIYHRSLYFRFPKAIFLLLLASLLLLETSLAQVDIIRVDTNLVTVPVSVSDRDGRYVTKLRKEDFLIFEDGVPQEIELFDSTTQPFTVFLLIDVSGSMSTHLATLNQAANIFVDNLRPDDFVTAGTFADRLHVLFKPIKVRDRSRRVKILHQYDAHFTRIYDAVQDALKLVQKIPGRKAIVLFSDGLGDGLFASHKDNFREAEEGEALIYTVQFQESLPASYRGPDKEIVRKSFENANSYMRILAQMTGGRPYQINNISSLQETFKEIADELGRQYSLGYYSKTEGKKGDRRQIKVKVNRPDLAVRSRTSYVVASPKK